MNFKVNINGRKYERMPYRGAYCTDCALYNPKGDNLCCKEGFSWINDLCVSEPKYIYVELKDQRIAEVVKETCYSCICPHCNEKKVLFDEVNAEYPINPANFETKLKCDSCGQNFMQYVNYNERY